MSTDTGISLTDVASEKVASLLAQEGRDDLYLRVAVQPGGCSGLRYQLYFDDRAMDDDIERENLDMRGYTGDDGNYEEEDYDNEIDFDS